MITDVAKRKIALFLQNFASSANVGIGSNSTFPSATGLDVPILAANKTAGFSSSESDDTTVDFAITFTGSELEGNTISEFAIFGTVPQDTGFDEMYGGTADPATTGANYASEEIMFARVNFDAVGPFASTDSIEIILVVEIE